MTIISAPQARAEYFGGAAHSTLWRWQKTIPNFPPIIRIGGRKFYRVADIEAFIASRAEA